MHWANGKIELGIWNIKKYIIFFKNVFGHIKRIAVTAIHQKFHLQSEIGCMSDSESHVKGQWRPDMVLKNMEKNPTITATKLF